MGRRANRQIFVVMFACLAIHGCAGVERRPAKPITKIEARTLPPQIVTRRSIDQLAAILALSPYPSHGVRQRYALEDLWFWTAPRGTGIPDLCQADLVVMQFVPDHTAPVDAETPTRVHGITATPAFHFLAPPKQTGRDEWTPQESARTDEDCRRLDPEKISFFHAEDPKYANSSAILLSKVLEQIISGQPRFELTCTNSNEPCAKLLKGFDLTDLLDVRRCNRNDDVFNVTCTQFRLGDLRIDVFWPYAEPPDVISRVSVAELIVLGHTRID
jgi:hypothetical protein